MALAEAPSAAMAIRVSSRRTSSSSTKTAPAIGALNATASPAPAPAASRVRRSGDDSTHLHARTLAPERHAGPDGEQPADEFDRQHAGRGRRQVAGQRPLDLRDTTARGIGRMALYQPRRARHRGRTTRDEYYKAEHRLAVPEADQRIAPAIHAQQRQAQDRDNKARTGPGQQRKRGQGEQPAFAGER